MEITVQFAARAIDAVRCVWDWSAGSLILAEAGGALSALEHDDYWQVPPWSRSVIAARTVPLLEDWRAWIRNELAAAS